MMDATLLHDLPFAFAERKDDAVALTYGSESLTYGELALRIRAFSSGLMASGLPRASRVATYLEKRFESVIAAFGTTAAGGVFVPVNPVLKPEQVFHILIDCNVLVLVTSAHRLELLRDVLARCAGLRFVIVVDGGDSNVAGGHYAVQTWPELCRESALAGHRIIDTDMAAILYTSGSTGRPKGVVLSHRNMVSGAKSVASYLQNRPTDALLAVLPLSFDAGFSQLTTAFHAGARVVLLNYLLPKDVVDTIARERVTGLTAIPPLYIQLSQLEWPESIREHVRYFANTGGKMPLAVLKRLRWMLPAAKPYLMYGFTEAFRATYLSPDEVDRRPDSIGKAIPNAEILVLRRDGSRCGANEPGELVQRGSLVAMGYWNDPEKTAERFKALPGALAGREAGLVLDEIAAFSGDVVRQDEHGFLYFIGRKDEMIKTSGYRVSPTEVEEVLYGTQMIGEAAAFGVPHPTLGQAIVVVATSKPGERLEEHALAALCRERLPLYMVPARIAIRDGALPRNATGKIDRKLLSGEFEALFQEA